MEGVVAAAATAASAMASDGSCAAACANTLLAEAEEGQGGPRLTSLAVRGGRGRGREDVFLWQVAEEELNVMTRSDSSSIVLGTKPPGTIVRGWQIGLWVGLADEPGYLLAEREGQLLLKKASAPVQAAAAEEAAGAGPEADGAQGDGTVALVEPSAQPLEAPPPACVCFACGAVLPDEETVRSHLLANVACLGEPWQATVQVMAALPGARSLLWCPACPEGFAGRWSGSATKASMLLRHLSAAGGSGEPHAAEHTRLLQALVALLLEAPPEGLEPETLHAWAPASRLLIATGPLLAVPGPAARRAVARLQNEVLGEESGAAAKPQALAGSAGADPEGAGAAQKGGRGAAKRRKREQQPSGSAGPSYDFYNEEIPMDVVTECHDATVRTADGVPIMDLLDSSEDEPVSVVATDVSNLGAARQASGAAPGVTIPAAVPAVSAAPAALAEAPVATPVGQVGHWL